MELIIRNNKLSIITPSWSANFYEPGEFDLIFDI